MHLDRDVEITGLDPHDVADRADEDGVDAGQILAQRLRPCTLASICGAWRECEDTEDDDRDHPAEHRVSLAACRGPFPNPALSPARHGLCDHAFTTLDTNGSPDRRPRHREPLLSAERVTSPTL